MINLKYGPKIRIKHSTVGVGFCIVEDQNFGVTRYGFSNTAAPLEV